MTTLKPMIKRPRMPSDTDANANFEVFSFCFCLLLSVSLIFYSSVPNFILNFSTYIILFYFLVFLCLCIYFFLLAGIANSINLFQAKIYEFICPAELRLTLDSVIELIKNLFSPVEHNFLFYKLLHLFKRFIPG